VGACASFRPTQRLLTAADYRRVFDAPDFKTGRREFLVLARCNQGPTHRLGLAIAKKHVPTAVRRNLIKRLARENFRHMQDSIPRLDIVLLTRPSARDADRDALRESLQQLFLRVLRAAQTGNRP
jgi:ribonuclease P protein component